MHSALHHQTAYNIIGHIYSYSTIVDSYSCSYNIIGRPSRSLAHRHKPTWASKNRRVTTQSRHFRVCACSLRHRTSWPSTIGVHCLPRTGRCRLSTDAGTRPLTWKDVYRLYDSDNNTLLYYHPDKFIDDTSQSADVCCPRSLRVHPQPAAMYSHAPGR
jgi:hypothetical protein